MVKLKQKHSDVRPVSFRKYKCSECYSRFYTIHQPIMMNHQTVSYFKAKKSVRKLLLWVTTAETEQTRVNKIKTTKSKQGCKTNTLLMVYL